MYELILDSLFILMGVAFIAFNKAVSRFTQWYNRRFFKLEIPLHHFELSFKVAGIFFVVFGIYLLVWD